MKVRLLAPALLLGLTALPLSGAEGTTKTGQARDAQAGARCQTPTESCRSPSSRTPGQLDRRVRYSAQAGGSSFFFTGTEAVLSLARASGGSRLGSASSAPTRRPRSPAQVAGTGRVNYLLGNDPASWHTNLPTYGELVYRDLWPGIDLVFRGRDRTLKYEFHVAPGADASRIRLAYRGAAGALARPRRRSADQDGARGSSATRVPSATSRSADRRVPVASRFALGRGGTYGFTVGAHDRRYPLVIDPGLVYSTYLGRELGTTTATGSPSTARAAPTSQAAPTRRTSRPRPAPSTRAHNGGIDAFVTKLNAAGSALVYSTYLGGSADDAGLRDRGRRRGQRLRHGPHRLDGLPHHRGRLRHELQRRRRRVRDEAERRPAPRSSTRPTSAGAADDARLGEGSRSTARAAPTSRATPPRRTSPPPRARSTRAPTAADDAFVTKLNATGSALVYSTYLGGSGDDQGSRDRRRRRGQRLRHGRHRLRRTSRPPRAPSTRATTATATRS